MWVDLKAKKSIMKTIVQLCEENIKISMSRKDRL